MTIHLSGGEPPVYVDHLLTVAFIPVDGGGFITKPINELTADEHRRAERLNSGDLVGDFLQLIWLYSNSKLIFIRPHNPTEKDLLQKECAQWVTVCLGENVLNDVNERNHRYFEESLELVRSLGLSRESALALVEYEYSRPIGEPKQELGGVQITLGALAECHGYSLTDTYQAEMDRVWINIPKIREKQKTKPRFGDSTIYDTPEVLK